MLTTSPATRVWLAAGATDLRAGFDRLCILAESVLGQQASGGHLFVFCNASRTRVRILYFDGTGLWLLTKRLEPGLTETELDAVVDQPAEEIHGLCSHRSSLGMRTSVTKLPGCPKCRPRTAEASISVSPGDWWLCSISLPDDPASRF